MNWITIYVQVGFLDYRTTNKFKFDNKVPRFFKVRSLQRDDKRNTRYVLLPRFRASSTESTDSTELRAVYIFVRANPNLVLEHVVVRGKDVKVMFRVHALGVAVQHVECFEKKKN